jgi:hypothetical protein
MAMILDGTAGVTFPASQTPSFTSYQGGAITSGTVNAGGTTPFPSSGGPTAVTFSSIPSWVKRITVMFNGVSTSGTSNLQCQIGTSGGVQSTGYNSVTSTVQNTSNIASTAITTGFGLNANMANAVTMQGAFRLSLVDSSTGIWVCDGVLARGDTAVTYLFGGVKTLSGTLDRVVITTVGGTDTFDAGSINILYE